jgi:hypothetical protein
MEDRITFPIQGLWYNYHQNTDRIQSESYDSRHIAERNTETFPYNKDINMRQRIHLARWLKKRTSFTERLKHYPLKNYHVVSKSLKYIRNLFICVNFLLIVLLALGIPNPKVLYGIIFMTSLILGMLFDFLHHELSLFRIYGRSKYPPGNL